MIKSIQPKLLKLQSMKISVSKLFAAASLLTLPAFADSDGRCYVNNEPCPDGPAIFDARGEGTCSITIGGLMKPVFQFVDVSDRKKDDGLREPEEYQNFKLQHMRLLVEAKLGTGWSGVINADFANCGCPQVYSRTTANIESLVPAFSLDSSCLCTNKCSFSVDKAYIQKTMMDATFRFGYQKVNFGAEEVTPDEHLKTIYRSVATNFFMNLGLHASAGSTGSYLYSGQRLGGRYTGIFVAGQVSAFHYTGALVNGYRNLCCNSSDFSNTLGGYASLACDFGIDCVDFLGGVNVAFQPKGASRDTAADHSVYGVNPYLFMNYDRLSIMAEVFHGFVQKSKVTSGSGDSTPWGFNLISSFMLNNTFELVGRFSYANSDNLGMTIHNTFGCAPDNPYNTVVEGPSNANPISSQTLFEKVYAGYIGFNYYMLSGAVKASLGLEQAKFKNRANTNSVGSISFDDIDNAGANVNCVRAALQFLF